MRILPCLLATSVFTSLALTAKTTVAQESNEMIGTPSETSSFQNNYPDSAFGSINPYYRPSGSPYLWISPDQLVLPQMITPVARKIPDSLREGLTNIVVYDLLAGVETVISRGSILNQQLIPEVSSLSGYAGSIPIGEVSRTVFPPDDRVRITPTTSYPWRTICKLYSTFPSGTYIGSGSIIGREDGNGFHVLTAGHNVYDSDNGGWVTEIEIIPGLDTYYMPFNNAWGTSIRTYDGWSQYEYEEHDWAVVTLDRTVGNYTGWMGRQTESESSPIYTGVLNLSGYPGDLDWGLNMYWGSDYGRTATEYNHWYWMDTYGGQSGSPVWRYDGQNRFILSIHTHGNDDGTDSNHGTRLNQQKFDDIILWINSDTLPVDYADLIDDGQDYSGFSPTSITTEVDELSIWCAVRNIGTSSSGTFHISYYASSNTTITPGDYFLGTDAVSSISPFTWQNSGWNGTVSSNIPEGTYYVGWIIDSNNVVDEFDESNNTAYKDLYTIEIIHPNAPQISGWIRDYLNDGIENVALEFSNGAGNTDTDANGYYSHEVAYGWSGYVTPDHNDWQFSPTNRYYTDVVNDIEDQNFDGNMNPQLSNGLVTPTEGGETTVFTYLVNYYDLESDPPEEIVVHSDDRTRSMTLMEGSPADGTYSREFTLNEGSHTYYFSTETQEYAWDRLPESGSYEGPLVDNTLEWPILTNGFVIPLQGDQETIFTYSVHYFDPDFDPPGYIRVYVDYTSYSLYRVSGETHDGVYEIQLHLDPGQHSFHFRATDSEAHATRFPDDYTNLPGPNVDFPSYPPAPIEDLAIQYNDGSILLDWSSPVNDIVGNQIIIDHFRLFETTEPYYDSTELSLIAEPQVEQYIVIVSDSLTEPQSHFYTVTTVGNSVFNDAFAFVPSGTFVMGYGDSYPEGPEHEVTLTHDFLISRKEVTTTQYVEVLQWAFDNELIENVTDSTVIAYGELILDMDYSRGCEISWDGSQFSISESELVFGSPPLEYGPGAAYPEGYSPANHPVSFVTWYGAAIYCDWISMIEGYDPYYNGEWNPSLDHNPYEATGYRLPTEAEWEYAAQYNHGMAHPWGSNQSPDCSIANIRMQEAPFYCVGWSSPVGSYPLGDSFLGISDLIGNVYEMCNDWLAAYTTDHQTDPYGPSFDCTFRVRKGADWNEMYPYRLELMHRNGVPVPSDWGGQRIGFRVVRVLNEQ